MLTDLVAAWRGMSRAPRFFASVCLILGLGIGASAAVWSTVRVVLLEGPPVAAPQALQVIERTFVEDSGRASGMWVSYPMYEVLGETLGDAAAVAAFTALPRAYNLTTGAGASAREPVEIVSGNYFGLLGVTPGLGRPLVPADDAAGAAPAVVLTHATAQALFGTAAAATGKVLSVDGHAFEVVGVAPRGFLGLSRQAAAFVPMSTAPLLTFPNRLRGTLSSWHQVVLRPSPETSPMQIAGLLARAGSVATERFGGGRVQTIEFAGAELSTLGRDPQTARTLWIIFGGVVALLLLACANAANLVLMRGITRGREFALKAAIGASYGRLVRAQLLEGLLIAAGAALTGIVVAGGIFALLHHAASELTLGAVTVEQLGVDGAVVAIAGGFALATVLIALLAPAIINGRLAGNNHDTLARANARRSLVALEVALAMVLLVGAGLMFRSAWNLQNADLGYAADGVLLTEVAMPKASYRGDEGTAFLRAALDEVAALPGVERVAFSYCPPPEARCDQITATAAGGDQRENEVVLNQVSAGYFAALQVPFRTGRGFGPSDDADGAPVVVLSERAAVELFGGTEAALGERIRLGVGWPQEGGFAEVVGVVGDIVDRGVGSGARPLVYTDWRQLSYGEGSLLVRGDAIGSLRAPVAAAITALDPSVVPWSVRPVTDRLLATQGRERLVTASLGGFSLLALVLAASGVFAMLALVVAQRNREIGVRIAIGARPRDVFQMVMRDGVLTVAAGALAGLLAAYLLADGLNAMLYGVAALDATTHMTAFLLLVAVGAAGAAVPALRAARLDPMRALRDE